jgi:hypothetical protein
MHDWIIIGAGPSGLTCATHLPGNTMVLEKRSQVGGCHRVQWNQGFFSEHGPRVYHGGYVNASRLFREHGIRWDDAFQKTDYAPDHIDGQRWYQWMSWRALAMLTVATAFYWIGVPLRGSVRETLDRWGIRDRDRRMIDTVCRFSDGSGIDRYTLGQFVSGFDYHVVYPFYTPRQPLDTGLWGPIRRSLESRGVVVKTGIGIRRVLHDGTRVYGVVTESGRRLMTRRVVLCLPPVSLSRVLKASGLYDFGDLSKATTYIPYWSYSIHVRSGVDRLVAVDGFTDTSWGLIWMDLPMHGVATRVLSVAITRVDAPSDRGLVARGAPRDAVIAEILRQLPLTPEARANIVRIVPTQESDHAYVAAAGTPRLPQWHPQIEGLAMVGCANGMSRYDFTSIESAVQNAMAFCGVRRSQPWTMWWISVVLAVLAACVWLARRYT